MTKISREEILKLAKLSRLQLTEEEVEKYRNEISNILQYVEQLNSIDLKGVRETNQVTGLVNVFREDKLIDYSAKPSELLKNAPSVEGGHLKVKRMIN